MIPWIYFVVLIRIVLVVVNLYILVDAVTVTFTCFYLLGMIDPLSVFGIIVWYHHHCHITIICRFIYYITSFFRFSFHSEKIDWFSEMNCLNIISDSISLFVCNYLLPLICWSTYLKRDDSIRFIRLLLLSSIDPTKYHVCGVSCRTLSSSVSVINFWLSIGELILSRYDALYVLLNSSSSINKKHLHGAGWKQPFNIYSTLIWYHWLGLNLYCIINVSTVLSPFFLIVVWNIHWATNTRKYFFTSGLQVFTTSVILKLPMNIIFYVGFTGIYYSMLVILQFRNYLWTSISTSGSASDSTYWIISYIGSDVEPDVYF